MNEIDARVYKVLTSARELTPEAIAEMAQIPLPKVRASLERLMQERKATEISRRAGIGDDAFITYWSAR
jgi:hypothetical protein